MAALPKRHWRDFETNALRIERGSLVSFPIAGLIYEGKVVDLALLASGLHAIISVPPRGALIASSVDA